MSDQNKEGNGEVIPLHKADSADLSTDPVADPKPVMTEAQLAIKKAFWMDVLGQVIDTPRFIEFMDANYHLERAIDEENKTIHIRVTEKPPVLKITGQQIFQLHHACISHGVKDATKLIEWIMKILGGDSPLVTPAEEQQLQSLRDKLDP